MNLTQPTTADLRAIELLFFEQMRLQTRRATDPVLRARLRSFDLQCTEVRA